jgi:hypothetical protein
VRRALLRVVHGVGMRRHCHVTELDELGCDCQPATRRRY